MTQRNRRTSEAISCTPARTVMRASSSCCSFRTWCQIWVISGILNDWWQFLPFLPPYHHTPPHSEVSQRDRISIPKNLPREQWNFSSLHFPTSLKVILEIFFLCLQCNRKICFYLEAIQKSSLFLECEFTEDFSKGFLGIDCVRSTKGFYLWQSPWGFEGGSGVRIPGNWEAQILWKNKTNFQLKKHGQEMNSHSKGCCSTSFGEGKPKCTL